ncbi:ATP-binding protein [Verrucomicrobiota bacterium]
MDPKYKDAKWLSSILRYMSEAVIATDKGGLITFMNYHAELLTGQKLKSFLGKPQKELFQLFDHNKRTSVRIPTALSFHKSSEPRNFPDTIMVTLDKREIIIRGTLSPIMGYRSSIEGCVFVFSDTTKKMLKNRETRNKQQIEAIGNVVQSIALKFTNWLGIISSHASAIADTLIPNTKAYEEALSILQASEHAGQIPKRLLSIARASNINGEMEIKPIPLGRVIKNAINMVKATFDERKIILKAPNLTKTPYVMADESQLLDSILDLFFNAADAMPSGGDILIDTSLKVAGKKKYVVLRIRDTGCGIPKDILNRIFEPFFSTKEQGSATGLGLTALKSSIQRWGGYVKVRSQPGHGSSFRLFIPKAKVQAEKEAKRVAHAGGETILMADDKKEVLDKARDVLQKSGYHVHTLKDPEKVVPFYKDHAGDIKLSIIDVIMPGKDSKKIVEEIFAIDPTALIILTSGFSRDYVRGYLGRGSWEFIQKPFRSEHFLETIRRVLSQKSTATQRTTIR